MVGVQRKRAETSDEYRIQWRRWIMYGRQGPPPLRPPRVVESPVIEAKPKRSRTVKAAKEKIK